MWEAIGCRVQLKRVEETAIEKVRKRFRRDICESVGENLKCAVGIDRGREWWLDGMLDEEVGEEG